MKYLKTSTSLNDLSTQNFSARVEELISKPTTRKVNLVYKSCCGCGCHNINLTREVPFDSELKDGDYINEILETDEL